MRSSKMDWSFPSNNNGEVNGIGHSGIETFQGTPLKSLAREICQNSLDAAIPTQVVKVEFVSFQIKSDDFPGINSLTDAFEKSKKFWSIQKNKKTREILERGLKDLTSENIHFLRVSDFNTSGLLGSKGEYNTPWLNLTKSSGASDKAGTSGGSFGIGKFAPFACSSLRTVFYGTHDTENIDCFQGISRIVSFEDNEGETTIGTGYFGGEKNSPLFEQRSLDPNYSREAGNTGTDIYISGFKYHDGDWKDDIIRSVLDGFLYAIYSGTMIVRVDDILINSESLPVLMQEYVETLTDDSENADKYYRVLTEVPTWFETNFKNMGTIKLKLMIDPDLHRKVAMIRKTGMKIMDRGRVSGIIPFAGVMIIEGDEINEFLRVIENPQHTKWEPNRLIGHESLARSVITELGNFIKEKLDLLRGEENSESIDPSVGEFLPDEGIDATQKNKGETETIEDKKSSIETTKVKNKFRPSDMEKAGEKEESDIPDKDGTDTGPATGSGHGNGKISSETPGAGEDGGDGFGFDPGPIRKIRKTINPNKVRVVCLKKNQGEYSIVFVPSESAESGQLELFLSAETQSYPAPIIKAKCVGKPPLKISDNNITGLIFEKNIPIRIIVTLHTYDYCSLEVKANGFKI